MREKSDAQQEAIWSLIAKKLSHELTPEEESCLNTELEQDRTLAQIESTLGRIGLPDSHVNDETRQERILHRIYDKIFNITPRRSVWRIASRAAAFIALAVSIYLGANHFTQEQKHQIMTAHCPKGVYTSMMLPDSSIVYLNGGSSLSYPIAFSAGERQVDLEGEGYFEVKHDATRPFTVNTKDIAVKVLGTSFNVKSYLEDQHTVVTLAEGSIAINFKNTLDTLMMKPNDQLVYERSNKQYTLSNKVDTEQYTMWREGRFAFKQTTFTELCKSLERRYGCTIVMNSNKHNSSTFTGKFNRGETLEQVLGILKLSTDISYNINGNTVYIY